MIDVGGIAKVEIKIGNGDWIPATGTYVWTYQWDTTSLSDGDITITARATTHGEQTVTDTITVTVKNGDDGDGGSGSSMACFCLVLVVIGLFGVLGYHVFTGRVKILEEWQEDMKDKIESVDWLGLPLTHIQNRNDDDDDDEQCDPEDVSDQ